MTECCKNGDVEGARNAIESGVDLNSRSLDGKTALMYALWNNQNAVVEFLLGAGNIDVICEDNDGASALHHAVDVDNGEGARLLLSHVVFSEVVNHKNRRGLTPLMRAVMRNKVNCAKVLLADNRLDLDTRDRYKRSPQELKRLPFELSAFTDLIQLLLFLIRAVSVELEPVSKVLLDGLYDVESNLAKLRGCQHVMKLIWEEVVVHIIMMIIQILKMIILEVVEHKRKTVSKLGRTIEEVVATTPRCFPTLKTQN